ncbi:MAG: RNA polymerase II mediator complex subunit [Peltula sp. TS41687]|nr:MAG: RNA polymerase II mediator complex subunit [Peltula sp. TS41687]
MSTPPLSLPLRVWPEPDPDANSLSTLIQRINEQKGQFRNVTEQSLEEDILASGSGDDTAKGGKDDEKDETSRDGDDEVGRKETLLAAKEDILKQVGIAYVEAYYALDFVSLLLSKHTPRQAELSMSKHLKDHAPLGSLGAEKVQAQREPAEVVKDQELVCKGWKLQSLNAAADALIKSATRLETEIEQEAQYWEEILAIDRKRWLLCRLPRERHTLGVRFGFLEAATEFRERGLAALRRGDNGRVMLDQGFNNSTPKAIRVRIQSKDGKTTGSSSIPSMIPPDSSSVEDLILQARNSIYEEELYHESSREARILTNQGVRIHDSTIVCTLPDQQQQILIDLIPLKNPNDEASTSLSSSSSSAQASNTHNNNNTLAQAIALALRLLLSQAHRQTHHRRTQPPPPLTDRKRPAQAYSLLRPVLTYLHHEHTTRRLGRNLNALLSPLHLANLPASLTLDLPPPKDHQPTPAAAETLLSTLPSSIPKDNNNTDGGLSSLFHLSLPPHHQTTLTLRIHTRLYPPVLGTEYVVTSTSTSTNTNTMRFTTPEETLRYIAYCTVAALVDEIVSSGGNNDDGRDGDTGAAAAAWMRGAAFNEVHTVPARERRVQRRLFVSVGFADDEREGEGEAGTAAAKVEVRWGLLDGKMPTTSSSSMRTTTTTITPSERKRRYVWTGKDGGDDGGEEGQRQGPHTDSDGRGVGKIKSFRELVEEVARWEG